MAEEKFPYTIPQRFWDIAVLIHQDKAEYIRALSYLSKTDLIGFIWILQAATARITGDENAEYDPEGSINSDAMAVIAQGKEKYLEVYGDKKKICVGNRNPGLSMLAQEVFRARFHQDVPVNYWKWDDQWESKGKSGPWSP